MIQQVSFIIIHSIIKCIYLHNPEATYVRTYKQWNDDFGRTVNHGEKGITLLRPTLEYLNSEEKLLDMLKDILLKIKEMILFHQLYKS